MRTFVFAMAVLVTLLSGAWFVVASQVETRAEAALADLEARGWQVDYAGLATTGFPSRFDTTVTRLRLASRDGRLIWETPSLRLYAASYRPNRVVALWPQDQTLAVAGQTLTISAQGLRASATAGLSADLPLDQATMGSGLTAVDAKAGWGIGMDRLVVTADRTGPAGYDLFMEAEGLRPAAFSANIGLLRLDAQVALDAPVMLRNGVAARVQGLTLRELRLAQGDVALTGSGSLAPDAQGYLAGTITLAAENWRGLLDLLQAAGLLLADQRVFAEGALEELAQGGNRIEVPVTFANGRIEALGLVLLDAPRVL
jgi:hypothetical protein